MANLLGGRVGSFVALSDTVVEDGRGTYFSMHHYN